jgi:hypothetical protein
MAVQIDFWERLKEIDMFFDGSAPVHHTMQRLTRQLQDAGIAYAVMGGMAVNAHGVRRTTDDLDVLVTAEGLQQFRQQVAEEAYEQPTPKRTRRFVDRQNNVIIDFLVTGLFPGRGEPVAFAFPDPVEASEEINHVRVVTLVQLVQLKLAARRYQDFADVVHLIRVHNLDESFMDKIHPSVRSDYIECLEEHRRDEEYKAREGIG